MKLKENFYPLVVFIMSALFFTACEDNDLGTVIIKTNKVGEITGTYVQVGGYVKAINGASVTRYGICYSTSPDPIIINGNVSMTEYKAGDFTCLITDLKEEQKYYARAFAFNQLQTLYGENIVFTTKTAIVPTVETNAATDIKYTSTTLYGNLISTGGTNVTEVGFCYSSTHTTPSVTNVATNSKLNVNCYDDNYLFSIPLSTLKANTKYYVRAYAKNSKGYAYGSVITFTTASYTSPTVTTTGYRDVGFTSATVNGNVSSDGGVSVTTRGICYGTSSNPTINNSKKTSGSGTGTFAVQLTGLSAGTTYYARAYATNGIGTTYGSQVAFTTTAGDVFEIASGTYVKFAPGNLQYRPSSQSWRFASNQYDYIGEDNANISSTYSGYIDLFGYGTSGYTYKPYSYSLSSSLYASSTIYNTKHDWGQYCYISNGGGYSWYTMSANNWAYLYSYRTNAANKRSRAVVNGVEGFIFLPEVWILPTGCTFYSDASYFSRNTYSLSQWMLMEKAGAVFLPAAGRRVERTLYSGEGCYWSSTWSSAGTSTEGNAFNAQPDYFVFSDSYIYSTAISPSAQAVQGYGRSVRLVRKVAATTSNAPERLEPESRPHAVIK